MSYGSEKDTTEQQEELVFLTETKIKPGGYVYERTTLNGLLHAKPIVRDGKIERQPSEATYDPEGNPIRKVWHEFGKEHNLVGPAQVHFHNGSDQIQAEVFKIEGNPRASELGIYRRRWNVDGSLWKEEYADEIETYTPITSPGPYLEP